MAFTGAGWTALVLYFLQTSEAGQDALNRLGQTLSWAERVLLPHLDGKPKENVTEEMSPSKKRSHDQTSNDKSSLAKELLKV